MRRWALIVLAVVTVVALAGPPVGAQSNEMLDRLLEREQATHGETAYLVLVAAGRLSEDSSPELAAAALVEQGWKIVVREAGEAARLGEYAYLLAQAFELKGGVMYRLLPGPRYAARELSYMQVIQGSGSPSRTLSGEEAVRMLGSLLDWKEGRS